MIKKLPFINSALLLILIGVLISLFINSTKKQEIVFVNNIELFNNFNMTKDLNKKHLPEIEKQKKKIDSLYAIYTILAEQENVEKVQEIEAQLRFNDQELKKKSDYLSEELSQQVWTRLNKYMSDYGKENNYKIILGTQGKGNVMYAEEGLDVTNDFLTYANNIYEGN